MLGLDEDWKAVVVWEAGRRSCSDFGIAISLSPCKDGAIRSAQVSALLSGTRITAC